MINPMVGEEDYILVAVMGAICVTKILDSF